MREIDRAAHIRRLEESRAVWNAEAATFDDAPDHGLRDASVRNAWTALLAESLQPLTGAALDIGCGTGSLSLVLAALGFDVTGIDVSPEMIALARRKAVAANFPVDFSVMDAAFPEFPASSFNAIVSRHVLWALPDPARVLERWVDLLRPGGRLILVEGFWHTGAGLHADDVLAALPASLRRPEVTNLSGRSDLWGSDVADERYLISADLR